MPRSVMTYSWRRLECAEPLDFTTSNCRVTSWSVSTKRSWTTASTTEEKPMPLSSSSRT